MTEKKSNVRNVLFSIVVSLVVISIRGQYHGKKLVHYDGELHYFFTVVGNSAQ